MPRRSRLLCPCPRSELIFNRMRIGAHGVPFDSLFDLNMSSPLLREMWHGAHGIGALAELSL